MNGLDEINEDNSAMGHLAERNAKLLITHARVRHLLDKALSRPNHAYEYIRQAIRLLEHE